MGADRLFGNIVNPPKGPANKRYTVPGTIVGMVFGVLLFAVQNTMAVRPPEIPNQSLSRPYLDIFLPQPPPLPRRAQAQKTETPAEKPAFPTEANKGFHPEPERPDADPVPPEGPGWVPGDDKTPFKIDLEPPPPPPAPKVPVRVGGAIRPPVKQVDARPVYPPIAQAARVQGLVIIEAAIGPDGMVRDAKVLRSIPLLDQAALDAVRQWRFTPTLLNGVAVPVIMTVTVQFTLQ